MTTTRYDQVRYPSHVRRATYPSLFAVPAVLMGHPATPLARSRVFEIGCGEAAGLIAMAVAFPEAEFHGIDLAESAIEIAQTQVEALGLTNVKLEAADLTTYAPDGVFDYVFAHGVYAWVPPAAREGVMRLSARALAPDGLAYVSYNAQPGGWARILVGDCIKTLLADVDEADRLAALPDAQKLLKSEWQDPDLLQRACLFELENMMERPPEVVFHDELGEFSEPQSLGAVAAQAAAHGLDYVCDSMPALLSPRLHPSAAQTARLERAGGDWLRYDQFEDVAVLRQWRQSLFRKSGRPPLLPAPHEALNALWMSGTFKVEPPDEAGIRVVRVDGDRHFRTDDVGLCSILEAVDAEQPQATPVARFDLSPAMARALLRLYTGGLLELTIEPYPLVIEPSDRPETTALVRRQAVAGEALITNLTHWSIRLETDDARRLLALLDGTRSQAELAEALGSDLTGLMGGLQGAARAGLLAS